MRKILISLVDIKEEKFFLKLIKPLKQLGFEADFITTNLLMFNKIKAQGVNIYLIPLEYDIDQTINSDLSKSISVLSNSITKKEAEITYKSTFNLLNKLSKSNSYDAFFMWNGTWASQLAIKDFAARAQIKTLFFELGNIPNKIFVDPEGVNAQSSLYKNIELLKQYESSQEEFDAWKNSYIKEKLAGHVVPQAVRNKDFRDSVAKLYYSFIGYLSSSPNDYKKDVSFLYKKLKNNEKLKITYDDINLEKSQYLFFPMQVSSDTQILLNSNINLIEAIKKAQEISNELNLKLLIKPHPAESDYNFIENIFNLKDKHKFKFVNNNTFQLIKNAQKIVTINSTVGLESKIFGKDVIFLGRSFFERFDERYLRNYIMKYLINTSFFDDKEISVSCMKDILSRCNGLIVPA